MKVYWFTVGDPDVNFFTLGNRKPNLNWCLFRTKIAAYRHAYKVFQSCDYFEPGNPPEDADLEYFRNLFKEYGHDLENGRGNMEIIELEVWK